MTAAPTSLPGGWGDYVAEALDDLEARHLMRRTQTRDDEGSCGTSFGGNDYLGLARNLRVRRAAAAAALDHGGGPRGSLLVCGYSRWHARLEATIARMRDDAGAGRPQQHIHHKVKANKFDRIVSTTTKSTQYDDQLLATKHA